MDTDYQISIRSLIGHVLRSGDLESRFTGPARALEGIRAHQVLRKDRPETYVSEVPVSRVFDLDGFSIMVTGRIDGVFSDSQRTVIDEIKTTSEDLDLLAQKQDTPAWAQVKCYGYLYCLEHGLKEIDAQLTLYRINTSDRREIRRQYRIDDLEEFFQDLLARYIEWIDTVNNWCRLRDLSIREMEFPFRDYRPGQRAMAVETYRAVQGGSQLLVRGATGIGKTMAALFPCIKAMAEGLTSKIFYLTAKTTARAAAEKALDELRGKGLKMKSVTLTAKEKICFLPDSACSGEECEFASGYFDRVNDTLKKAFSNDAFTRESIESIAWENRVCPFELSLDLALWADCIICDYNYVFDPKVYLKRFFNEGRTDFTLLVDEAHNLEDRSREMFSGEIRKQAFLEMRRSVKQDLPHIHGLMGKINKWMLGARKRCEETGHALWEREQPEGIYPLLKTFAEATERWLSLNYKTPYREKLLDLYFDVMGFIKIFLKYDESYVTFIEKSRRDLRIKLFCVDPSGRLRDTLTRCRAAVFFSATMTPLAHFKRILGCDESAEILALPSPFPGENLRVIIAGGISTLYRHRSRTGSDVASAILTLILAKRGNYLLFFPSYEYMMSVYNLFRAERPDIETIIQRPGMAENDRDLFLVRFSADNPDTLAGFVVMGGIFGEGIDLVGERLSGAVIVGVGLPAISPEKEIIREYFDDMGDDGFAQAYSYPGINRVLQAAGRVIRSEADRGVVLLADKRFLTQEYQSLLPLEWNPVVINSNARIREVLDKFWGRDLQGRLD